MNNAVIKVGDVYKRNNDVYIVVSIYNERNVVLKDIEIESFILSNLENFDFEFQYHDNSYEFVDKISIWWREND